MLIFTALGHSVILTNCRFIDNTAAGISGGGAIYVSFAGPTLMTNCIFKGNSATGVFGDGGALSILASSPFIDAEATVDPA